MSNRSSKVRVSLDVAEEEKDSALALQGESKENEKTPKAGKGEKLGTMEMKKGEWKTAGSDAAADSDEGGIILIGKTSTPMTRSTKTCESPSGLSYSHPRFTELTMRGNRWEQRQQIFLRSTFYAVQASAPSHGILRL